MGRSPLFALVYLLALAPSTGCFLSPKWRAKLDAKNAERDRITAEREAEAARRAQAQRAEAEARRRDEERRALESDPRMAALVDAYASTSVAPLCNGNPSVPAEHSYTLAGRTRPQACGMVAESFDNRQNIDGLILSQCEGISDQDCLQKLNTMFLARIRERYRLADQAWIENHCTGYPDDCDNFRKLEGQYLVTHNQAAHEAFADGVARLLEEREKDRQLAAYREEQLRLQKEQLELQREEARRARARAIGEALEGLGRAMQPATVNCTSTTLGFTTHTTCR